MKKWVRNKRGQFVIIAALIIAALTLATVISIYEININMQSIAYKPVNEFLLGTTSDMNRALTISLARYTDSILNQGSTEDAAILGASNFMTMWKQSMLTSYSSYGIKINPTVNFTSTFDHNWNGNSTYSFAYIPYDFDVASYGFMGWVGSTEKYVQLQIYSATVNTTVPGQTSLIFQLTQSDVNENTPIPISDLLSNSETFKIGAYIPGNPFSPTDKTPTLVYLGNGNYSVTFKQAIDDPTTQCVRLDLATPNDGIWVSAYSPAPPKVSTQLSSDTIALGQSVSDSVSVAALDRTPSGSVTFWVSSDGGSSWTQFGSAAVLDSSSKAVSDSYMPPMPGTYYFMADYLGDSNNLPSQSGATEEPLTVQLATPTVRTTLFSSSISLGQPVHDTAIVTGLGGSFPAPSGSVTFWVSTNGGVSWTQFGSSVSLVSGSATSADYTPLAAGTYYFQARYFGDGNYNAANSGATDEPLSVSVATPTVTTLLNATSITLSQGVHDTATVAGLGGSFPAPSGSVTFYVSTDGGNTFTPFGGSVSLVSGSATSVDYTPLTAGNYYFQARYSGDNNYNAASSGVTAEPLTVSKATSSVATELFPTSIAIGQSVSDTATVIGLGGSFPIPTGTVTFYVSTDGGTFTPFGGSVNLVGGSATSDSYVPRVVGTLNFQAWYSGDGNYNAASSGAAAEPLTVGPAIPGVSTLLSSPLGITLGQSVTDLATVTGTGGSVPTGTVTFYVSTDHINWEQFGVSANLDGFGKATSSSYTPSIIGTYYFMADYLGDINNLPAHSGATEEPLAVQLATPTVTTNLYATSITLGQTVHDTATVAGLGGSFPAPTGSVTFWVSTDASSWAQFGGSVSLVGGSAISADYLPLVAGNYYFQARYSGDSNYNVASSGTTDEPLTVVKVTPSVTTLLSGTSITLGQTVHDTATVAGLGGSFPAPTGSVTFWVSTDASSWAQFGGSVSLVGGSAISADYLPLVAGNYYFQARYSGDSNYNVASSGTTDEPLTVSRATLTVTTRLSQTTITWGSSVTDTATAASLGNNFPIPSGKVDFYVSTDGGTTWTKFDTKTLVSGSATSISYTPASFAPALSGTDYFKAVYLGDSNYVTASSGTNEEPLTVNSMNPGTLGTYYIDYIGSSGHNSFLTTNPISPLGKVNPALSYGQRNITINSINTVPTILTTNPIYVTYVIQVKEVEKSGSKPNIQTIQTQVGFSYNGHSYLIGTATFAATASDGNPPPTYYTVAVALDPAFRDGFQQTIPAGSYIQLTTTLINPKNRLDLDGGIGGTRIIFF